MAGRVSVVGAGSWGTVMAANVAGKAATVLWARRPELAAEINGCHRNRSYLGELPLPDGLRATSDLEEALSRVDVVVMAVPSHGFRDVLTAARCHVPAGVPVVSLTKGVEQATLKRMTEVVAEILPGHPAGVLTGPNLAGEIAAGQPAASVIAMVDPVLAVDLQRLFGTDALRVYTNPDVIGCEVAGALKNVMAIACGISDGMGFGDNTRAALITRGLAEMSRLGVALGGQPVTFSGLAGMGDLVVTCISPQSRNRRVGEELGRGRAMDEIVAETSMVAEGIKSSRAVLDLATRHGIEMPIAEQVVGVLYGGKRALDVVPALMQRVAKPEHHAGESFPTR